MASRSSGDNTHLGGGPRFVVFAAAVGTDLPSFVNFVPRRGTGAMKLESRGRRDRQGQLRPAGAVVRTTQSGCRPGRAAGHMKRTPVCLSITAKSRIRHARRTGGTHLDGDRWPPQEPHRPGYGAPKPVANARSGRLARSPVHGTLRVVRTGAAGSRPSADRGPSGGRPGDPVAGPPGAVGNRTGWAPPDGRPQPGPGQLCGKSRIVRSGQHHDQTPRSRCQRADHHAGRAPTLPRTQQATHERDPETDPGTRHSPPQQLRRVSVRYDRVDTLYSTSWRRTRPADEIERQPPAGQGQRQSR